MLSRTRHNKRADFRMRCDMNQAVSSISDDAKLPRGH